VHRIFSSLDELKVEALSSLYFNDVFTKFSGSTDIDYLEAYGGVIQKYLNLCLEVEGKSAGVEGRVITD